MASFDWDDVVKTDESSFELLEPGEHGFVVTAFERGYYDGGPKMEACPKAIYTLDFDGTPVRYNLFLNEKSMWRITQFFKAVGLIDPDTPSGTSVRYPWEEAVYRRGVAETRVRTWTGSDGEARKSNDIVRCIVPKKAAPGDFGTL